MEWLDLIITCVVLLLTAYLLLNKKYSYWEDRDVPSIKTSLLFGSMSAQQRKTTHISQILQQFYNQMKDKATLGFGGLYFSISPTVLAIDLDFVKNILVRDFQHFQDRGVFSNEKDDPLSAHLFNLEGQRWRTLRAKLTPTFTSGKMKMMFPTIIGAGKQFKDFLEESVVKSEEIEMKDLLARFTTDVIGTCAFGIDCNSMKDPNSLFRVMGKKIFDEPRLGRYKRVFTSQFPGIARFLGMKFLQDDVSEFFLKIVADTIEYREKNEIERNDFMDLLMKLKKSDKLSEEENEDKLTFNEIAAQAFIFFLAGFETSSTTMTYCLYELSLNLEIQEQARKCIIETLNKHDGQMSYEALLEMSYLDQCINETLRMYPPVSVHFRKVTKDYPVPNSKLVLPKGKTVLIPVYAIQRDPDYYPNPDQYNPDRFTAEEMAKRNPMTFTPFGEGPRICIGLRFGMMQARIGLAYLLSNFKFSSCSKSVVPLVYDPESIVLTPAGGLWLNVEKI